MGRWDIKDKTPEVIPEAIKRDMDNLCGEIRNLPQDEQDLIRGKMEELFTYAQKMVDKEDKTPPKLNEVVAMAILLYTEYDTLNSAPLMIAAATSIARRVNMNPSTYRTIASMITSMCKHRFK